jgi:hypothetical protein
MWEPRRLTTLWASKACYRDSSTILLILCISSYLSLLESSVNQCQSINVPVFVSVYLSIYLSSLYICLCTFLSLCLSVCLCLMYFPVYLFIYVSFCIFRFRDCHTFHGNLGVHSLHSFISVGLTANYNIILLLIIIKQILPIYTSIYLAVYVSAVESTNQPDLRTAPYIPASARYSHAI